MGYELITGLHVLLETFLPLQNLMFYICLHTKHPPLRTFFSPPPPPATIWGVISEVNGDQLGKIHLFLHVTFAPVLFCI